MKYTLFKIHYIGKAETPFNTCLNNHRPDVSDPNAIPSCRHFAQSNHDFKIYTQFTLIDTKKNRNKPTNAIQNVLRKRKSFYINIITTLHSHDLNQKLYPK